MLQLGLWLAFCFFYAWVSRSRPILGLCGTIVLWFAIPAIAGDLITGFAGAPIGFHPSSWLIAAIVVVQLASNPTPMMEALARHVYLWVAVWVFVLGAFLTSQLMGTGGSRLLVDQVVAPTLVFWLVTCFAYQDLSQLRLLRNTLLLVVGAQCLLTLIQSIVGNILFYAEEYETLYWFDPERFDRWMGTTDSPLALSLVICVTAPMIVGLRHNWLRLGLLVLFWIGTLITQSRTGALTMALLTLYILLRAQMSALSRILYAFVMAGATYLLVTSTLVEGLASRLVDDTGSAQARADAFHFFGQIWPDVFFAGRGLTASYTIADQAGLITSLESSYLMYAVDAGVILATLYFGAQFVLALQHLRHQPLAGVGASALIGVVLQHTFSAVAGTNVTGTVIWLALAMLVVGSQIPYEQWILARRAKPVEVPVLAATS